MNIEIINNQRERLFGQLENGDYFALAENFHPLKEVTVFLKLTQEILEDRDGGTFNVAILNGKAQSVDYIMDDTPVVEFEAVGLKLRVKA